MAKKAKLVEVPATEVVKTPQQTVAEMMALTKGKSLEELREMEKQHIADADKHQMEASEAKIEIPEEGKAETFTAIRELLNTMDVNWQLTLGMREMYDFFDPETKDNTIPYPVLDTMLGTLVQRNYKGYKEWDYAVRISEYFEAARAEYGRLRSQIFVDAQYHSQLMQLIDSMAQVEEGVATEKAEA